MKAFFSVMGSLFLMASLAVFAFAAEKKADLSKVRLETSLGDIVIELNGSAAPKTVENFIAYVKAGFYDGTIFHRVMKGFMVQGGGFTSDMQQKVTKAPVSNEADNGLQNLRGTLAMARTPDPHSATAQFFINTVNNRSLDYKAKTVRGWGYCVFGKVIAGMDVVDAIEKQPTSTKGRYRDVPLTPVIIKHAVLVNPSETSNAPKKEGA